MSEMKTFEHLDFSITITERSLNWEIKIKNNDSGKSISYKVSNFFCPDIEDALGNATDKIGVYKKLKELER